MVETIRAIDDIFLRLAETQPLRQWVLMSAPPDPPLDDAVEEMWTALESGNIRLVVDGKRMAITLASPQGSRWPRRTVPCASGWLCARPAHSSPPI
jgi:hypothetical protein